MRVGSEDLHAVWQSRVGDRPVGHDHFWQRALSRRRFITTALASSAALGLPAFSPAIAQAAAPVLPNPINGGTVVGPFGLKHFYFPTSPSPVGPVPNFVSNGSGDASTIRDFRGTVGLAEFPPTGVVTHDPFKGAFWAADLRFMQGSFIGRDNHKHRGTFAFIWLDVFMGAGGTQQVHDFNPAEENGLFWTVPVPEDAAEADLEDGNATFELTNFTIDDYGNAGNALGGGKDIATASLTVRIRWRGLKSRLHASQPGFPTPFDARELQAFNSGATMYWSAVENGQAFAGKTNTADFAMLARERNGVFFESGDDD